jgi:YfdX protein
MKTNLKKLTLCILLATGTTLLCVENGSAATPADRIAAATKHKILNEKAQPVMAEAAEIESDTQKAIIALNKKDAKGASTLLQGVSSKLDSLLAKNPGVALIPLRIKADAYDFEVDNKTIKRAIAEADDLLGAGKLQAARRIVAPMASEIRVTTTSIPLGSFPAAIKKATALIEAGNHDQAAVDLSIVLDTLQVDTEVMPLPVLRAEELLSAAAELEHRDDLSKEQNRKDIRALTDATKDQLETAQLLGYGGKKDYKALYDGIDGIDKELFSDQSAATWQKIKDKLAGFKDRLKDLSAAAFRAGHPAK